MAKIHRIVVLVTKQQKEQIIQNSKFFNHESVAEYMRESVLKRNFLVFQRLDKINKIMEELKNEKQHTIARMGANT